MKANNLIYSVEYNLQLIENVIITHLNRKTSCDTKDAIAISENYFHSKPPVGCALFRWTIDTDERLAHIEVAEVLCVIRCCFRDEMTTVSMVTEAVEMLQPQV